VEAPVCLNNDAPKKYESPANKPSVKKKEVVEVSDEVQLEPQPEISTPAPTSSRNLEFRVQFMMSKNKISAKTFSDKGLSDVFEYRDGGYYKYATSNGYATVVSRRFMVSEESMPRLQKPLLINSVKTINANTFATTFGASHQQVAAFA